MLIKIHCIRKSNRATLGNFVFCFINLLRSYAFVKDEAHRNYGKYKRKFLFIVLKVDNCSKNVYKLNLFSKFSLKICEILENNKLIVENVLSKLSSVSNIILSIVYFF